MAAPPGGSRVEWSQQDTTGTRKLAQSQPNWDTWASQERTWNIIDIIDNISKELGKFCVTAISWKCRTIFIDYNFRWLMVAEVCRK